MALVFCTVLWALWYVSHRGFSRKWRQVLTSEIEKRGVHVSVGRLTLNPLQGLVARNVVIMSSRQEDSAKAFINEIVLDINYSNLVHHQPFLNGVELRNATLLLPLDSSAPENKNGQLKISRLNARVLLPPHCLTIEQAKANVRGMRVTASGRFVNPEQFQWSEKRGAQDQENPLVFVSKFLNALDDLKVAGGNPALEIRCSGDLAKPSDIIVETTLQSGGFSIGDTGKIETARISATLADGRVRIDQCEVKDASGTLDATGALLIATGDADFHLRSTLDLPGLIHAIQPDSSLKELVFYDTPLLEMNGTAQIFEPKSRNIKLLGCLSVGRFAVKSLLFESAGTDFSWGGSDLSMEHARWYLHDARIHHKDGDFVLNAMQTPGDFRFNIKSQINPNALLPLLPVEARAKIAEFDFEVPPILQLEGHGSRCSADAMECSGHVQLGVLRTRGTSIKSTTADVGFKANVLAFRNIKLERSEGVGTGTVLYDLNTEELQFQNVRTTLNPVEVIRIFDRNLAEQLLPYRFKERPALVVNGKVGCAHNDWQRHNLHVGIDGARGMDYTFLKKDLSTSKISGTVNVIGERLKLENLDADIFGGHLRGKADISLRKAKGDYTADFHADDVDFPALTKLYLNYDTSKGKLNASFAFSGLHDFARAIDGKGQLIVTDGNVFAIPIFGPFSSILNDVLPGTGYNIARKGTCTFEMRDGIVSTRDLVMEGRGFSILGAGKIYILEDKMDFSARINAQGLPGVLLDPVSHLLEYVSDGSLSKPIWRPKRLPKVMFVPHNQPTPAPVAAPPRGSNNNIR